MKRRRRSLYFYKSALSVIAIVFIFAVGMFFLKNLQYTESWSFMKRHEKETRSFVKKLGPGINLGNTMDSHNLHFETKEPYDFETYWGNPVTAKEMIEDMSAAGFEVLRVPVTWYEHMDDDYNIDPAWLERVQQIADYGLDAGMYVIINAHHDSWYTPDDEHLPEAREITHAIWSQIAERFQEYDQRLLFESMNEPRLIGEADEWSDGTLRSREIINELNEIFVRTIRGSGGENSDRYLILPTYCAKPYEKALKDFIMPEEKGLIVSIHLYSPYNFTLNMEGTSDFDYNNPSDTEEINKIFDNIDKFFISRDVPVIITEFSAVDKKNERQRAEWVSYVRKRAEALGIACIWWDAGPREEEGKPFPLYNRYTGKWLFPDLLEALTEPHVNDL